ncbi:hypothetical protein GJV85_07490 [Sulfurimonas aquatica]|uniref:Uncharacterized protein n=1 Tax=Sulfurimonas aquatica TaxID=2672570 RepID=A0A975B0G1_9BACT|nr:hypothetical protein [Sulfurimonas aquatica]QSZ41956.1 hypothetical protein GJV85_07490 [Sulfurimonas aquatica]
MIKQLLLFTILGAVLFASTTTTDTTFTPEVLMPNDEFGNAVYQREVKIETKNFKVDSFWGNFSNKGESQDSSSYTNVSKTGKVKISVESTSICTLYSELDEAGCSGQKPFLINNEALSGTGVGDTITLLFQKDYNYSNSTILYDNTNPTVFYPLDINRAQKYYKSQVDNSKSFFGFFTTMFNTFFGDGGFFSSFFTHNVVDKDDNPVEDIRERYIANIVSGVDQDHMMKTSSSLKTDELNNPVSLIDYTENISSSGSCNLFFFKFPENSTFCNFMGGMPFISMFSSTRPASNYTVDTIQADTENSLITFASAYSKKDITDYQDGIVYEKQTNSTGLIRGMMKMMKCMFFGCAKVNDVKEPMDSYYAYDDNTAVNLTMAVTNDGSAIDGFETFSLRGIHSLSGNDHMCQVEEKTISDHWSSDPHTFVGNETGEVTTTTCDGTLVFGMCFGETTTTTTTVLVTETAKKMSETVQSNLGIDSDDDDKLTSDEWLTWCDYMVDKYKDDVTTSCTGIWPFRACKEVPVDIKEDGYEILSYTNASGRGLILDLKRIQLTPHDKAVKKRYKLMSTTND